MELFQVLDSAMKELKIVKETVQVLKETVQVLQTKIETLEEDKKRESDQRQAAAGETPEGEEEPDKSFTIKGSTGNEYTIDPVKKTCTCKGFYFRGECKHLQNIADDNIPEPPLLSPIITTVCFQTGDSGHWCDEKGNFFEGQTKGKMDHYMTGVGMTGPIRSLLLYRGKAGQPFEMVGTFTKTSVVATRVHIKNSQRKLYKIEDLNKNILFRGLRSGDLLERTCEGDTRCEHNPRKRFCWKSSALERIGYQLPFGFKEITIMGGIVSRGSLGLSLLEDGIKLSLRQRPSPEG